MSEYIKKTNNDKMGRPKKEIDKELFEKLCFIQCTEKEICAVLEVSDEKLCSWCKKTYDMTFLEAQKKYSENGRSSLRRIQFRLAEKNPAMAIWLGKQYLGQTDKTEIGATDVNIQVVNDVPKSK